MRHYSELYKSHTAKNNKMNALSKDIKHKVILLGQVAIFKDRLNDFLFLYCKYEEVIYSSLGILNFLFL